MTSSYSKVYCDSCGDGIDPTLAEPYTVVVYYHLVLEDLPMCHYCWSVAFDPAEHRDTYREFHRVTTRGNPQVSRET